MLLKILVQIFVGFENFTNKQRIYMSSRKSFCNKIRSGECFSVVIEQPYRCYSKAISMLFKSNIDVIQHEDLWNLSTIPRRLQTQAPKFRLRHASGWKIFTSVVRQRWNFAKVARQKGVRRLQYMLMRVRKKKSKTLKNFRFPNFDKKLGR